MNKPITSSVRLEALRHMLVNLGGECAVARGNFRRQFGDMSLIEQQVFHMVESAIIDQTMLVHEHLEQMSLAHYEERQEQA